MNENPLSFIFAPDPPKPVISKHEVTEYLRVQQKIVIEMLTAADGIVALGEACHDAATGDLFDRSIGPTEDGGVPEPFRKASTVFRMNERLNDWIVELKAHLAFLLQAEIDAKDFFGKEQQ